MIDRPGTGLSPPLATPPTESIDHRRIADVFLVDVLDGLGIERANVVSTSLGAWSTFRSAAAHPDRFLRLCGMGFQAGARIVGRPASMRLPSPMWMLPRRVPATRGIVRFMLKSADICTAIGTGKFSDEMLDWMVALLRSTETFRNDSTLVTDPPTA